MLRRLRALAACSLLVLPAACGGDSGKGVEPSGAAENATEVDAEASASDLAGTYAFDSAASLEGTDLGEQQERLGDTMNRLFGGIESEMTLAEDHTYTMWLTNDATGGREETKGTWSSEGDRVTIRQTEANGVEMETTNVMTIVDGALTMTEDGMGGATMTLVYRRK